MKLLVSWGNTSPASAEVVRGDVTPLRGAGEARNEQGADTRSPVCSAVSTEPRTCWPRSTLPGACNTRNPTPLGQPRRLHGLPAHPTPRTHTEKWRSHARPTTRFCFFSNPTKLEMGGGLWQIGWEKFQQQPAEIFVLRSRPPSTLEDDVMEDSQAKFQVDRGTRSRDTSR